MSSKQILNPRQYSDQYKQQLHRHSVLDKASYRHQLEHQITKHREESLQNQQFKKLERKSLDQRLNSLVKRQQELKLNQRKMELMCLLENQHTKKKMQQQHEHQVEGKRSSEKMHIQHNLFNVMNKNEESRATETRNNFILQNNINDVQAKLKKERRSAEKMQENAEGRKYDWHIEEQYVKKLREQELIKNRYLRGFRNNASQMEISGFPSTQHSTLKGNKSLDYGSFYNA